MKYKISDIMFEHLMIWIHFLEYFGPSSLTAAVVVSL